MSDDDNVFVRLTMPQWERRNKRLQDTEDALEAVLHAHARLVAAVELVLDGEGGDDIVAWRRVLMDALQEEVRT